MYGVFLVDGKGNYLLRYTAYDKFDCEVWATQREYEIPKDCHYEVCKLQRG